MATAADIRAAVEQWARAKGYTEGMAPWYVVIIGDDVRISRRHPDYQQRAEALAFQPLYERHHVSPHAALCWALVLEARPLRDGTRCRRCRGRGTVHRGEVDDAVIGTWNEWQTSPCPDCDGTGLADKTDEYAQHVLDSQARPCRSCRGNGGFHTPHGDGHEACWQCAGGTLADRGNPTSIDTLHVLADRLQAQGDPLGLHLAYLLAGSREGTADAVERLNAAVLHLGGTRP
jgi:hypothetical protein